MSSTSANSSRRKPQQARAAARRTKFLDVAAELIGEAGYEGVTMTSIAEQAGASIGTLYDYFPDKQALTIALLMRYAEEADAHWKRLLDGGSALTKDALADLFIEGAVAYFQERPAFLPLHSAPLIYSRSPAAREPLRRTFADALQRVDPTLTPERAFLGAQVIVELIKALFAVCKQIEPKDREGVTAEFKQLMRFYLIETVA